MKAICEYIEISGTLEKCLVKINPHNKHQIVDWNVFDALNLPMVVQDDLLLEGMEVETDDYESVEQVRLNDDWHPVAWFRSVGDEFRFIFIPKQKKSNLIMEPYLVKNQFESVRSKLSEEVKEHLLSELTKLATSQEFHVFERVSDNNVVESKIITLAFVIKVPTFDGIVEQGVTVSKPILPVPPEEYQEMYDKQVRDALIWSIRLIIKAFDRGAIDYKSKEESTHYKIDLTQYKEFRVMELCDTFKNK